MLQKLFREEMKIVDQKKHQKHKGFLSSPEV